VRGWIIGILTLIGVVIIAVRLEVQSSTVGDVGGDALAFVVDVVINFFGSLIDGASSNEGEAVG